MTSINIHGINWSLTDGVIDFFGAKGRTLEDGKSWGINAFGGSIWVQVSPTSRMPDIRQCIDQDVAKGNDKKIAQVQLGARQAVVLFLEGKLTAEHLKNATESQDSNFIDVPTVALDDRTVTIRIFAAPKHDVATADSRGNTFEKLEGTNWSLSDGCIDFFGARGKILDDGKTWGINAFGGNAWVQVSPDSMLPEIRKSIEMDVAAGTDKKIAQLQLGPRQAVVLFLEGVLTIAHFTHANEPEGLGYIDIPGVAIEGRTLTVRVIAKPKHTVATADSAGNVL